MARRMAPVFDPLPDGQQEHLMAWLEKKTYQREAEWTRRSYDARPGKVTYELETDRALIQVDTLGSEVPPTFFYISSSLQVPVEDGETRLLGYFLTIKEKTGFLARMQDLFDAILRQPGESRAEQAHNALTQCLPGFLA